MTTMATHLVRFQSDDEEDDDDDENDDDEHDDDDDDGEHHHHHFHHHVHHHYHFHHVHHVFHADRHTTTHPRHHQQLTSSLFIPSMSSSYHDNHDNASSGFPVESNGAIETYMKKKSATVLMVNMMRNMAMQRRMI